jgi:flagellar basal body-associated protein FliL
MTSVANKGAREGEATGQGARVKMRFVALLLLLVVGMVVAVGCTATEQQTTAETESSTTEKTTSEEAITPSSAAPQDNGTNDLDKSILRCQLEEASKDNVNNTDQAQLVDEVYREAEKRNVEPEQVLFEHGYDCGWSALQQSGGKE